MAVRKNAEDFIFQYPKNCLKKISTGKETISQEMRRREEVEKPCCYVTLRTLNFRPGNIQWRQRFACILRIQVLLDVELHIMEWYGEDDETNPVQSKSNLLQRSTFKVKLTISLKFCIAALVAVHLIGPSASSKPCICKICAAAC